MTFLELTILGTYLLPKWPRVRRSVGGKGKRDASCSPVRKRQSPVLSSLGLGVGRWLWSRPEEKSQREAANLPERTWARVFVTARSVVKADGRCAGQPPEDWLQTLDLDTLLYAPTQPPPRPFLWPVIKSNAMLAKPTGLGGHFNF